MKELDKITVDKPATSFTTVTKKEIEVEDVVNYFINNNNDKKNQIVSGRVYQKNKKNKPIELFFKLLQEEINKLESKNNKDLDNSFFSLNKKILSSNIYNLKEIIKLYNIDENRIINFFIGTLIQSIYDEKD
jgi:hypothetical protein|tara:strand:+ start:394 stop:789 length:396 start_codon:yes stop_codon:yes gene_type:complete